MKRTLLRTLSASVLTSAVLMADGGMTRQEPGELRAMSQRTTISPDLQSTAHAAASLPVAPIVHWSLEAQRAIVVRPVLGVRLSRMSPLALESPWQFRPDGPNSLTSAEYAADLEQVKQLGRVDSAARTVEQTIQALFWTDHDLRQWNEGMLRIADSRGLGFVQTARMLAMAHVSGGDAMIACFDAKYHYMFWRPAVAIPQAHIDGNPMTEPDPTWRPLRATPNHPEYPAAHACHTTAIAEALATFFGTDKISLTLDSRVTGTVREYDRLREAVRDVNRARVLAGFHFRNSDQEGSNLGRTVARFVVRQFFQPLD